MKIDKDNGRDIKQNQLAQITGVTYSRMMIMLQRPGAKSRPLAFKYISHNRWELVPRSFFVKVLTETEKFT